VKTALVGCGLVGAKRARCLAPDELVSAVDADEARAQAIAGGFPGCRPARDWRPEVARPEVELVLVCTSNDALVEVARAAVRAGKHVLIEKPAARSVAELDSLILDARRAGVVVKVGFNHRFHPALQGAKALFANGAIGPLLYLRGRYGHGGRLGYEREWRADKERAGGGELLDQGVHLIDLARWFAGDFVEVFGRVATYFWDMPVEDNGFLYLRTSGGQSAWLHASWTEWKNLFSFEVFGRDGKLQIDGLGGSYGPERLTFYKMKPELGPPEIEAFDYPGEDGSWAAELQDLRLAIAERRPPLGTLEDARKALAIVEAAYAQSGALR
jgi:predicted dehydrogenase